MWKFGRRRTNTTDCLCLQISFQTNWLIPNIDPKIAECWKCQRESFNINQQTRKLLNLSDFSFYSFDFINGVITFLTTGIEFSGSWVYNSNFYSSQNTPLLLVSCVSFLRLFWSFKSTSISVKGCFVILNKSRMWTVHVDVKWFLPIGMKSMGTPKDDRKNSTLKP